MVVIVLEIPLGKPRLVIFLRLGQKIYVLLELNGQCLLFAKHKQTRKTDVL